MSRRWLETALRMKEFEQLTRMHSMRSYLRQHDVFRWFRSFDFGSSYRRDTSRLTKPAQVLTRAAVSP